MYINHTNKVTGLDIDYFYSISILYLVLW